MSQFEIQFNNGSVLAQRPQGPLLAGGRADFGGTRAYQELWSIDGVAVGQLSHARYSFMGCLPGILLHFPLRIYTGYVKYVNMSLTMDGDWLLDEAKSKFPADGEQEQIYRNDLAGGHTGRGPGVLRLNWESTERGFIPGVAVTHGEGGSVVIAGTITLTYPADPSPTVQIRGTIKGDFEGFPGAEQPVTGTFTSQAPARPGEHVANFPVRTPVLKGNWIAPA